MCIFIYVSKCVSESLASALDALNSSNVSASPPRYEQRLDTRLCVLNNHYHT